MDALLYLPSNYFPIMGSKAYKLLGILADGLPHPTEELLISLKRDPRSPLQQLWGDTRGFWLIHNIGTTTGLYLLDPRHLSGDMELDSQARLESEVDYRERSKKKSEQGAVRLPKAIEDVSAAKAKAEKQLSLDYHQPVKKPTQE